MRPLLLGLLLLALALPATASAELRPDTAAPPDAPAFWLPSEEWVMERWMPFDGARLSEELGMTREDVYYYLLRGHGNLESLARRQGVPVAGLAERLLEPRRHSVAAATWPLLLDRTRRMLDQRHLAEHVIGHAFHHWSIWRRPERIWGPRYHDLYARGLSYPQITRRVGVPRRTLRRRILRALARGRRRGLRTGALSVREAAVMEAWQQAAIDELVGGRRRAVAASAGALRASAAPPLLCALQP